MIKTISKLAAVAALFLGLSHSAMAEDDPAYIRIGVGYYDVFDDQNSSTAHVEYISNSKWWKFNPFVGVMGTTDSAGYVYGGVRLDLFVGDNWVVTPSFAPGIYTDGDGRDLGHAIEFRSALEVAYRFENRSRLGASLYHLSNAHIGSRNPGVEVLTLHYSHPIDEIFGDD